MYFGTHSFSEQWSWHAEAQWRRNNWITDAQQLLLRTGVNYNITRNVMITAGYCFVKTYPYGDFPVKVDFPENRIWQQLQLKQILGRLELTHRFRQEQRFIHLPVLKDTLYQPGVSVFQNRFRLLHRFSLPLNNTTISDNTIYLTAYDEVMISFGKNVGMNIFDQNRAYAALGYKVPKLGRVELGYMNQQLMKSDGIKIENNHTLQMALFSSIEFMKIKEKKLAD